MPEHDPQVGHAERSIAPSCSSFTASLALAIIASIRSIFECTMPSIATVLPASIGPPDTNTVGMFSRSAAISMPGVILSQLDTQTSASAQCALTMYSTESAISSREGSEYSMPPCPMAMPSSTAIVLNSRGIAPAACIASATTLPTSARCTWPGTNSVKLLATAMIGLPMSSRATPVARSRARAPAMFLPCVTVRDRSGGMTNSLAAVNPPAYPPSRACRGLTRVMLPAARPPAAEVDDAGAERPRLERCAPISRVCRLWNRISSPSGAARSGVAERHGGQRLRLRPALEHLGADDPLAGDDLAVLAVEGSL